MSLVVAGALLAGSYNPPTMAHLALAAAAAATGLADEVTLTISKVTVDKEAVTRATLLDRLLVLCLLLERINSPVPGAAENPLGIRLLQSRLNRLSGYGVAEAVTA